MALDITLYTDGACSGNPGPGGYGAILIARDDQGNIVKSLELSGGEPATTNNRMEIRAVIEGLKMLTAPTAVTIVSDSQYVIKTMTQGWKRNKNQDLWNALDHEVARHRVRWQYVRGHRGHEYNERCDRLAVAAIEAYRK